MTTTKLQETNKNNGSVIINQQRSINDDFLPDPKWIDLVCIQHTKKHPSIKSSFIIISNTNHCNLQSVLGHHFRVSLRLNYSGTNVNIS